MIPERFAALGDPAALDAIPRALVEQGYCIVRGAVEPAHIAAMSRGLDSRFDQTPFSVGAFHGERTKRFHRLLARSQEARRLTLHDDVLGAVRTVLGPWCDFPELNLTQGVEIHPGAPAQIPHTDQAMWPAPKGAIEFCVNVFWPLGPFTTENGATRIWPGTHARRRDPSQPLGEPVVCEMEAGDALMILGSTVHAAGGNRSASPRRAAIVSYCLGWLKAYENQSLAYSVDFAKGIEPELAALLGYRWHRPNLGTYDGQCPSILLTDSIPDHLPTVDALSPQHELLVADFAARERSRAAAQDWRKFEWESSFGAIKANGDEEDIA